MNDLSAWLDRNFAQIFGKQAMYDPSFALTWKFYAGCAGFDEPRDAGVSTSCLYVTYDTPETNNLYHTVVHTGCVAASGVTAATSGNVDQPIFDAIWGEFASRTMNCYTIANGSVITRKETVMENGNPVERAVVLSYYGKVVPDEQEKRDVREGLRVRETATGFIDEQEATLARLYKVFTTAGLLTHLDGTCGAWQNFAIVVFAAQGIQVFEADIFTAAFLDGRLQVNVELPGQGGTPKESIWVNHATIRYGDDIYDPSYGIHYGSGNDAKSAFIQQIASIGGKGPLVPITDPLYAKSWRISYKPTKLNPNIVISDFVFIGWD